MAPRARTLAIAVAATAILLAGALAESAVGTKPPTVVSANCHGHNIKPSRIILACGDAGLLVEHLKWKSWRRAEAEGEGTGVGKTCNPNCAAGGTRSGPMEIRLFKTARCAKDGRVHFTRIEYSWNGGSPIAGQPAKGVVRSPCSAV
jgi:hypothetical protein